MKHLQKDLYIDIDGVVLTKGVIPALYLEIFLKYILKNFSVSWLSTRCNGNSNQPANYLSRFLSEDCIKLVKKIKPTTYSIDKTEAINFNRDFYWLDNELFASEENTLKEHGKYDSWIKVNLIENPNQLLDIIKSL